MDAANQRSHPRVQRDGCATICCDAQSNRCLHETHRCTRAGCSLGRRSGLVCACDIAIAAEGASFAVSEAKFGILPSVIGPYVTNAIGKRQARRLALTTTRIAADEASAMGMVHRVVPIEQLDGAVDAVTGDLLAGGPTAQREIKALYEQFEVGPVTPDVRELTAATIARVRGTDEAREGFAAFLAKRPPAWIPR